MTAVATQTQIPNGLPRHGWTTNGNGGIINMTSEYLPTRKAVQRSNSSSSLNSTSSASSASTISSQPQTNGIINGDSGIRKKAGRGLWTAGKSEPVSGLSTARSAAAPPPPSSASAISALHSASQNSSNHAMNGQSQSNGIARQRNDEVPAVLGLSSLNGTFERKSISVPVAPDVLKIGRQTNAKTLPTRENGFFDSKVLSRQHAEVWADSEKRIWIRDVRSSNGTFVNGKRLSAENRDSEPHPLNENDLLELGIDIVAEDGKSIVHSKVAARVEHAGGYGPSALDINAASDFNALNGLGQQMPPAFRSRPSSQGSISSGRFSVGGAGNVAAYHSKWLQPVSMEQIAKRLSSELRSARLQSQDLNNTTDFVNAVISHQNPLPVPEPQKIHSPSKATEAKARFSEPPGPPPSQPLPEKPDAIRSKLAELPALQPLLRRSETEKPLLSSADSPTRPDSKSKISTLMDALTKVQSEKTSQDERITSLEESLRQEREARISAEQRVESLSVKSLRLDTDDVQTDGSTVADSPVDPPDPVQTASRLQERCDLLRVELEGMRSKMEEFRLRAESAEQERDTDRQSLAEMVAMIRKRDDAAQKRKSHRQKKRENGHPREDRADERMASEDPEDEEADDVHRLDREIHGHVDAVLKRQSTIKASSQASISSPSSPAVSERLKGLSPEELFNLGKEIAMLQSDQGGQATAGALSPRSRTQDQLVQSAPYASIVAVVLLGMGMMSYLNGWQKVVER